LPPKSWIQCKLGEYAEITMGQSPESTHYSSNPEDVPFLQGNRTFGSKYPHFDTYTSKVTKLAVKNSVLLSVRAPVGDVNIAPNDVCLGRGVSGLTSIDVTNEFLYYLLRNLTPVLNQNENGSTFGSINKSDLESLPILLPDITTRNKIATILSTIDSKIEINREINANLLELLKIQFTRVLKLSNDSIRLGDIADIQTGPFGSQLHQEDYVKDGTPLVSVENLGEFHLNRKHLPGITPEDCIRLSRYLMKEGDIIFSRVGYVDRSSYVSKMEDGWMFSGSCLRIRNNNPDYSLYTYLFLNTNLSKETFKSIAVGATRPSINSSILSEFEIIVPPKSDVKQFNDYALKLESMMTINMIEIEKLTILRDYLLPKLMSGEINVSTLEIHN